RSRSGAADPDRRCRRQVRGDADGYGAALCRHRRARWAFRTPRLAACPHSARSGPQDAARPRLLAFGRADLGWMGHRPSLPDSLPVLGPSNATPDVIYAFGHGHVGMTAAPMTGKVVADLVAGRAPSIDIAPFAAERFG